MTKVVGSEGREQHLQTLDLLRGVAAICVVLFHFSSRVSYGGLMYHGYLAVDFFFALSGYVICNAYYADISARQMSFKTFTLMRLIRLMPLVILGNSVAGVIDLFRGGNFTFAEHAYDILLAFVLGCFLLPTLFKTTLEDTTYPLNGPIWSLFFELFANLVFFSIARLRYARYTAIVICAVSLGLLLRYSLLTGNVHFGPHVTHFWLAFPRVLFSFFMGVLLNYTSIRLTYPNRWQCVAILIGVLLVPSIDSSYLGGMYDIAAIAFVFPLIIVACRNQPRSDGKISRLSGNLSYPIYCIHYPLVRVLATIVRHFSFPSPLNIILSLALTFLMAMASLLVFDLYDRPVRKKLASLLLPHSGRRR